jgi:hypothetical protein
MDCRDRSIGFSFEERDGSSNPLSYLSTIWQNLKSHLIATGLFPPLLSFQEYLTTSRIHTAI